MRAPWLAACLFLTALVAFVPSASASEPPSAPCSVGGSVEDVEFLVSCGITVCTVRPFEAPYVVTCYY